VWDLVVVGAGPAGATAALAARVVRPEARVLLLDRAAFPRDKPCGDGVAPHVLDVLGELGVTGLLADRVPVRRLELSRGGTGVGRDMSRPAYVVPRAVLDARLVEAAVDRGVVLRRQRVRALAVRRDRVVLEVGGAHGRAGASCDRSRAVEARVVVGADGAHSIVRRAAGLGAPPRVALALRGYAPVPDGRAGRQVIRFGHDRQPSYAWSFDRGDGLANVGYGELLRPRRSPPTRALMLECLERLLPGAGTGGHAWRAHHLPLTGARWRHPPGRVLLAGDAASLVNPLTGEGIYYAVSTGALAGRCAVGDHATPGDPGAAYSRAVRRLLAAHLLGTAAAARLATAPGVLEAGLIASADDGRVFDDLVELGLGRGPLTPRTLVAVASGAVRRRP
jgi:menaquinone-9 beta-reductase